LQAYHRRLLGIHLHDVHYFKDHYPPGCGEFNFSLLKPFLKKDTIKVIEAHQPATQKQIAGAQHLIKRLYNE